MDSIMYNNPQGHLSIAFDNVNGITWQDKLDTLAKCKCCERHQINKPLVFSKWDETEQSKLFTESPCPCLCRHMARQICRKWTPPGEPKIDPPSPSRVL